MQKCFFFTPPAYYTYRRHLDETQLAITGQTIKTVVDKYSNCSYVNLMADSSFVSADYYDADHLSEIGAKKLSILIDKYIRDIDFDYFNVVNGLNKR